MTTMFPWGSVAATPASHNGIRTRGRSSKPTPSWDHWGMDELVQVYASGDTFAAELMRGRLEAEDIPVLVKGEGEGPYRMGPLYLWVSAQDATRARVIVEAVESGDFALADEEAPAESSDSTGERPPA
jgi:hypothetical protein